MHIQADTWIFGEVMSFLLSHVEIMIKMTLGAKIIHFFPGTWSKPNDIAIYCLNVGWLKKKALLGLGPK